MDPIELSDDARAAKQPSADARACGIDAIEKRCREIKESGKDSRPELRKVAKADQKARERQHEDKAEKDMEEYLAICPTGVVAELGPAPLRDRSCHIVKLAARSFKIGPENSTSRFNV